MKFIFSFIVLICCSVFSEVTHSGLTGTNIHTSYRWLFADSTARANQTVVAADTMKLAYQRSDSSTWVLVAATGTKWRRISIGGPITGTTGTFSGTVSGTTGIFSESVRIGSTSGVGSAQPMELVGNADAGIMVTATDKTVGTEAYFAASQPDSTGTYKKTGAMAYQWTQSNTDSGFASWNTHATYYDNDSSNDQFLITGWAKHGVTFFNTDLSRGWAPGDKTVLVFGKQIITDVVDDISNQLTVRNSSSNSSALTRLRLGNNLSDNAFTVDVYNSNHLQYPNRVDVINQFNANLVLGAYGAPKLHIGGSTITSLVDVAVEGNINADDITADSITTNGTDYMKYSKGSAVITWNGFTTTVTDSIYYTIIGNQITINFTAFTGTSNSGSTNTLPGALPSALRPTTNMIIPFGSYCYDNGVLYFTTQCLFITTSGTLDIAIGNTSDGLWTPSGTKTPLPFKTSITYLKK